MKKVVLFGGGTGMSQVIKGLKLFPLEITAVVGVFDSGRSTGALRDIYDMAAVGDLTKVLLNVGDLSDDELELLNYRVKGSNNKNAYNHSLKNLILTSLIDIHGSFDAGIAAFCRIFKIKGSVFPLTTENVNLVAKMHDGEIVYGEDDITEAKKRIDNIWFDQKFKPNPRIFKALENADLIIIAPGSLYTSILPHLMTPEISEAIKNSKAKKMYICNLITQPGETINYTASHHLDILNEYLGEKTIDVILANNAKISKRLAAKYETREQKYPVLLDEKKLKAYGVKIIADKIYKIENNMIRHDSLKTAYLVYSYLMGDK